MTLQVGIRVYGWRKSCTTLCTLYTRTYNTMGCPSGAGFPSSTAGVQGLLLTSEIRIIRLGWGFGVVESFFDSDLGGSGYGSQMFTH